jgi:hypothetical protein
MSEEGLNALGMITVVMVIILGCILGALRHCGVL